MRPKPFVTIILDGVGLNPSKKGNALALAHTPNFDKYWKKYPHTTLKAHGTAVGLEKGYIGGSEVGHLHINAGRIVEQELKTINIILQDFFTLDEKTVNSLMERAKSEWEKSTGLFQFANQLNDDFNPIDKMDFIICVFEVAYADGKLHYLEHHTVKKIANILNLSRKEIITAKTEIENFLD